MMERLGKSALFVALVVLVAIALAFLSQTQAGATEGGGHDPVTICHKPGTPAEHTIVVDDDAVEAHLAHGDYLGECQGEPELVAYRVVAGMPRYRSEVFYAEDGLTCSLVSDRTTTWTATCGEATFSGRIGKYARTYVRLRVVGEAGPAQVLLDLR